MTLRISPDLALPLDFVTKTTAILAQRRKGKTYTASVLAEELVAAEQPFVVLDPTGAWWGLRASADGEKPGLPVVIFGGAHGDVPLERTGGKFVAELVVDEPGWYVIDFSLFESGAAEKQFATDFAERLYRRKARPDSDFPLHLFVDEADRFIPQRITDRREGDARMLGAFEAIVRRGGLRGLGTTLISQRAAVVNKNVLEMVDVLVLLRTVGPNDQRAVKDYVSTHGTPEQLADLMGSLSSLDIGEAWVWEPGGDPPLYERVRIRQRITFNSSATPKPGEHRVEPRRLAEVDLDRVKEAMAETIEKAKADDPKELRKEIAALNARIRALDARQPEPVVQVAYERVEVPVLGPDAMARLTSLLEVHDEVTRLRIDVAAVLERWSGDRQDVPRTGPASDGPGPLAGQPLPAQRPDPPARREPRRAPVPGTAQGAKLPNGPASLLSVLAARYPAWLTRRQVVTLAKRGPKSSSLGEHFAYLLDNGLIEQGAGGSYTATEAGLAVTGGAVLDDPVAAWHGAFSGATQKVFDALVRVHPEPYGRDGIADLAGLSRTSSSVSAALSELRRNGLLDESAEGIRAAGILFT